MNIQKNVYFTKLFPDNTQQEVTSYLRCIQREVLVRIAMLFIHDQRYHTSTGYAETFVSGDHPELASHIIITLASDPEQTIQYEYVIASRHSGLKLLQFIFSIEAESQTSLSDAQIIENITKALTLINEKGINEQDPTQRGINNDNILNSINIEDDTNNLLEWAKAIFSNQIVYSDFTNYPIEHSIFAQTIKADKFIRFCSTNPSFQSLIEILIRQHDCPSATEYLRSLVRLAVVVLQSTKIESGYPTLTVSESDTSDINFLNSIATPINSTISIETNFDSQIFRNNPLISLQDGTFLFTNNSFVVERMYNSLKFNLNTINEGLTGNNKVIRDFFSEYTTRFSEEYLFNQTIESCYKKYSYKQLTGGPNKCDYYIRNGKKLFLFEHKDIEYSSTIKHSDNFDTIFEYIKEKLLLKRNRPIGVGQLIRDINEIAEGSRVWDDSRPKNLVIYPILIISNHVFSTLGFNYILNHYFKTKITELNLNSHFKIKPLIIIDINTLLLLEPSLNTKKLKLEEELEHYLYFLNVKTDNFVKFYSFSDYIIERRMNFIASSYSNQTNFHNVLQQLLVEEQH